jgi:hypothetical protein
VRRALPGPTGTLLAAIHALALAAGAAVVVTYAGALVLRPMLLLFLVFVGAAAVAWPGSAAGLVAIIGIVVSYVTLTALDDVLDLAEPPSANRVLLIGACLYVAHATDALRGAVAGAALDSSVLVRWLRRLAEALVPGAAVGALVLGLPTGDGASPLWLIGAAAVLVAAAVPAFRVQRRPWRTTAGTRSGSTGHKPGPAGA